MNLQTLIDNCASLYLSDYETSVSSYLLPDLSRIVNEYCFDFLTFEEQVLQKGAARLKTIYSSKAYRTFVSNGHIRPRNLYARQWFLDSLRICQAYYYCYFKVVGGDIESPAFFILRLLAPEIHRDTLKSCVRPGCFWRFPNECICERPFILTRGIELFLHCIPLTD